MFLSYWLKKESILLCRTYAVRRLKDGFRENKDVSDTEQIELLVRKAEDTLELLKRQVFV